MLARIQRMHQIAAMPPISILHTTSCEWKGNIPTPSLQRL
ncbi:hypothetical protein GEOBRER4_n2755 [Citrifermentans bremense]|uniref:Uncharacterized protein n=1 Tax=Citrifermentans bremense TaxID=60035 RepID=A0A7R7FSC1_9BACT|nr:hypothetical protein GEOBRER4_n2755 [Citrifermentans bremense]